MPKVSVVLVSYNKPDYVGAAIQSVIDQDFKDWELFIADDNSDEQTQSIIHAYVTDPRVTIFQSNVAEEKRYDNCRYALLNNLGIEMTTGKYLTYLSDDVVYMPNRLGVFSEYLDTHPSNNICYGGQDRVSLVNPEEILSGNHFGQDTFGAACNIDHSSMMHRRKILVQAGFWPEGAEYWANADAHFFRKLTDKGNMFYWVDGTYEISYITPQSLSPDRHKDIKLYKVPWEKEVWF